MKKFFSLRVFAGFVTTLVIIVIGVGLYVAGSPEQERLRRLDEERVNNLQQISSTVQTYYEANDHIPATIEEIGNQQYYVASLNDPKTGAPYEYIVKDDLHYELCAIFATDTSDKIKEQKTPPPPYPANAPLPFGGIFWRHSIGYTCFSFTVTPIKNRPQ